MTPARRSSVALIERQRRPLRPADAGKEGASFNVHRIPDVAALTLARPRRRTGSRRSCSTVGIVDHIPCTCFPAPVPSSGSASGAGGYDVTVGPDGRRSLAGDRDWVPGGGRRLGHAHRPVDAEQGFGIDAQVGDVDSDGKEELIAAPPWDFVWAYDVDTQLPKWSLPALDTGAIYVGQFGRRPAPRAPRRPIAVRRGQVLRHRLPRPCNGAMTNPEHGITLRRRRRPERERRPRRAVGLGFSSTGPDHLLHREPRHATKSSGRASSSTGHSSGATR